ncbi:MAG: response regulator [Pseudomonadota bacterium]
MDLGDGSAASLDVRTWVAAVGHDLREPMNAIVGMSDLLLQTPLDDDQRDYAEAVRDAATTVVGLVNDLLDVTRLERGNLALIAQPFDVRRLVERTAAMLRPRIGARELQLDVAVATTVPAGLVGDAGRLRQVLTNLLANALKFTDRGRIVLSVDWDPMTEAATFVVSDTGCGMPAALRAAVGRPFVQGTEPPTHGAEGLGLGLAISHHLVGRMGGRLSLESAVGQGTAARFTVTLAPTDRAPPLGTAALGGRTVCLVEATTAADRIADRFHGLGLRVVTVADLEAARACCAETRCAAVFAVARQPTAAHAALARSVQEERADVAPVLVALAPAGYRGDAEAWREAGFHGYLTLPVEAEVLRAALGTLLAPGLDEFVTTHRLAERRDGPWRLLVVDDNPVNVRLLQVLLEREGHEVVDAADGATALERMREHVFDAVLMDLQMPGIDGLETTRRIRAMANPTGRVPVLAVTAAARAEVAPACAAAGIDVVLTKPIEPTTLCGALQRLIVG